MSRASEIIARHAGRDSVECGELVRVSVDRVYMQDGNTPTISRLFKHHGFTTVFDRERVAVFFDHAVLSPEGAMTDRLREAEAFADELGLVVFRAGRGISHIVAAEEGWFVPGSIVVGADSHTCTGGADDCLALGMGASDVVAAMVTGLTWLKVPETVVLRIHGTPSPYFRTKDLMLYMLSRFSHNEFLYRSIEWRGEWLERLSADASYTIANLCVELGAKCSFLSQRRSTSSNDDDVCGEATGFDIDIGGLPPFVARPHSPETALPLAEVSGQEVDYVFIGTCTNGRYEDLAEAAGVLDGATIAPRVHCIVTPGSAEIYGRAIAEGVIQRFISAGAIITPPGCGPCVGTQGTIPASGDRVLATSSRNFRGRMGRAEADIWLASPLVAARAAVTGRIPTEEELCQTGL